MERNGISFEMRGIGSMLASNRLSVPLYQRSYSWGEDQVSDFFNDLRNALDAEDPGYFLGTIVLSRNKAQPGNLQSSYEIIDGQQRLSTTALLLIAIRNLYFSRNCQKDAEHLGKQFLFDYDFATSKSTPRLTMNSDDNNLFKALVESPKGVMGKTAKHSQELMYKAGKILERYVANLAEEAGPAWREVISKWINFLDQGVNVVEIVTRDESDAYLIFETLNDRGADLTISDLLKNYLLGRAAQRINEVRDNWVHAVGIVEMASDKPLFTVFLRQYWSSKHGTTRERELYKNIKDNVTTPQQVVDFTLEMVEASQHYAALQSASNPYWSSITPSPKSRVETLLLLGAEQIRPLLLAAMQFFSDKELSKLLQKAVSWSYRFIITGRSGSGSIEKAYCDAAVRVRRGELKRAVDVQRVLMDILPKDDEFSSSFAVARITKDKIARYSLCAIENKLQEKSNNCPELVTNADAEKVNLEHVLPKRCTEGDWDNFDGDQKNAFAYRLGNMTLLTGKKNRKIASLPWEEKIKKYEESPLEINKRLCKYKTWTSETIEERQQKLATLAVEIWKL